MATVTFAQALELWGRDAARYTPRTWKHYQTVLNEVAWLVPLSVQSNALTLNASHLYQLSQIWLRGVATNRIVNAKITAVMSFCKWLASTYHIPNPSAGYAMLPERPANSRVLTDEEYRKLLSGGSEMVQIRAKFIANTGVRASEFCGLMFEETDSKLIHHGYPAFNDTMLCVVGKGLRRRYIPLNQEVRDIVADLRKTRGRRRFLFGVLNKDGTDHALNRRVLYEQFAHAAASVGIPMCGPHALRHWFGTKLLTSGMDVTKVANLMGHSIRVTAQVYAHWLPSHFDGTTPLP